MYDFYSYFVETTGICPTCKQKQHSRNRQTSSMQFSSLILGLKEDYTCTFTVAIVHVFIFCHHLVKFIFNESHLGALYIFVAKFINIYLWAYSYTVLFVVFVFGLIFANFLLFFQGIFLSF